VVEQLFEATTMRVGRTVNAKRDKKHYGINVTVQAGEMPTANSKPHAFHEEWNYSIRSKASCICRL